MRAGHSASLGFDTLRLEGALLLPDVLEKAAQGSASRQSPADYHVPKGFTVQEEIGRAFRIAQAQWKAFSATFERVDLDAVTADPRFRGRTAARCPRLAEFHATANRAVSRSGVAADPKLR